jgi:putative hydrolase of the HAD superfamily
VKGTPSPCKGLLFDYGSTLVDEVGVDLRAGNDAIFRRASYVPSGITRERLLEHAENVAIEIASRRQEFGIETPWLPMAKLIYESLGLRFDAPMLDLELDFWKATMTTRPMAGVQEALEQFRKRHLPMAVVSNTMFGSRVIEYELSTHGLSDYLSFVMTSSEYIVRKPHLLLFKTAAMRLGVDAKHIWFVGDRLDTDVHGANAAGMTSVWFNPHGKPSSAPHITVAGWSDLVRHVDGVHADD